MSTQAHSHTLTHTHTHTHSHIPGYIPNNYVSPVHQQPPIKLEAEPYIDVGGSPSSSDQASPYTAYSYDGNHGYENMVMLDGGSSGFQMEQSVFISTLNVMSMLLTCWFDQIRW